MALAKNKALWRFLILQKYDNKCADCGVTEGLHAHHIKFVKKYPELELELDNGIALCHDCHIKRHNADAEYKNWIATAISAAAATITAEKMVTLRLTEYEYNELKAAYAKEGVRLATGIKTAALWLLQTGATVTRAGVMDNRG